MSSRREALHALAGLAALPFFGKLGVDELIEIGRHAHQRATAHEPRALTPQQYEIVTQAAERIIPRTTTPGATDARVADFIDVMLADWYSPAARARFTAGVDAIAARGFGRMTAEQQAAALEALDHEVQALRQAGAARPADANDHWFAMLKYLTVWGYYTSRPGIVEELRVQLSPGRYDGNAKY